MTTATKRKKRKPIKPAPAKIFTPRWTIDDGVSFSGLSKWVACRERFRLHYVEGLREVEPFNHKIEYGSLWHEAEEAFHNFPKNPRKWKTAVRAYAMKLRADYPTAEREIDKWATICIHQFPLYIKHWQRDTTFTKGRRNIFQEEAFRVSIPLPSGRSLTVKGRFDGVWNQSGGIWLQENKTKGKIDEEGIAKTLTQNLQSMLYVLALMHMEHPKLPDLPVKGILYNVVRRPLSDFHAPRQRKAETDEQFAKRAGHTVVADNPKHYFKRWKVPVTKKALNHFCQRTLFPVLENFVTWWESIEDNPDDPWFIMRDRNTPNPHHWQTPFGVYNSLFDGYRGDFFPLLTTGRQSNLERT